MQRGYRIHLQSIGQFIHKVRFQAQIVQVELFEVERFLQNVKDLVQVVVGQFHLVGAQFREPRVVFQGVYDWY